MIHFLRAFVQIADLPLTSHRASAVGNIARDSSSRALRRRGASASGQSVWAAAHGSLEGVGGLKTNESYHSKADALLIPEMFF